MKAEKHRFQWFIAGTTVVDMWQSHWGPHRKANQKLRPRRPPTGQALADFRLQKPLVSVGFPVYGISFLAFQQ
jgi:hypothetical protein